MSPTLLVTEDTPPDMLSGHMDLRLVLPNSNRVKMSVDRRTPMMDLLVQVTTAYKISPAGHVLQPYGESGLLPYKPSTPIVHIVPKNTSLQNPANKIGMKQLAQPFEQTFRFQVNLPRNQLYVTRVSGRTTLVEVLQQACSKKELDPKKYTLKHPKNIEGPSLSDDISVAEYGYNQVIMVSAKALPSSISAEDIIAMKNYITKSNESSSRSLSPDSSVSPRQTVQPSRPTRKRRPAPKPPVKKDTGHVQPVACHSRTSSDSSGYHEASVLSESPDSNNSSLPDSLPRRSKLPDKPSNKLSRSLSNLHHASTSHGMKPAQSRKKKAAPPPPLAIAEEKEETPKSPRIEPKVELVQVDTFPVGRVTPKTPVPLPRRLSSTNIFDRLESIMMKMNECGGVTTIDGCVEEETNGPSSLSDSETQRIEEEIERMFDQATREHVSLESGVDVNDSPEPKEKVNEFDWEYKLPAPPTFRDDSYSGLNVDEKAIIAETRPHLFNAVPVEAKKEIHAVVAELTDVLNGTKSLQKKITPADKPKSIDKQPINNFKITTYSTKTEIKHLDEKTKHFETNITRRSSFVGSSRQSSSPVKRSVSQVSRLNRFSSSNVDLAQSIGSSEFLNRSRLRKTNSELSVIEPNDEKDGDDATELQSLQVLRTILPQLSRSQGAINSVGLAKEEKPKEKKEEISRPKVNLSVSTWGERPKRQISIKSDKDYANGCKSPPAIPVKSVAIQESLNKVQPSQSFKTKTSVYKTLETGNTKPLKQILDSRPVVRSVELKKPFKMEEKRPVSCYLFGYEPPKPEKRYTSIVDLRNPIGKPKPVLSVEPREQLLESIRCFGKNNLRKVSSR